MANKQGSPTRFVPAAGALALGCAIVGLAALSGQRPTRPWTAAPARSAPVAARLRLRPVAYHPQPITIKPSELLAITGRVAPEATFRVQLTNVLQDGELTVSCPSGLLVVNADTHRLIAQVPGNTAYTVSMSADGRALSGPGGGDLPGGRVRIQSIAPNTPMETGPRSYLGALEVRLGAKGLEVVNEVHQEDYIAGVVAGEAARSFPLEALKAQAVAARTYAISQRGHRGGDVDVVDTVADQVYTGAAQAWPEVRDAVQATAGQILTYRGRPIVAYFSADCGGETRTNADAGLGSSALPYLRAVSDKDASGRDFCAVSPKHTWTQRLAAADILPKLNAKLGTAMEALKEIQFTRVYSDGRVGEVGLLGLGAPVKAVNVPAISQPAPGSHKPIPVIEAPEKRAPAAEKQQPSPVTPQTAPGAAPAAPETPPAVEAPAPPAPEVAPAVPAVPPAPESPKVVEPPAEPVKPVRLDETAILPISAVSAVPDSPTAFPEEAAPGESGTGTSPDGSGDSEALVRPEIRKFLRAFDFRRIIGTTVLRSQIMSVEPDGEGAWLFSGRGYGHGVGLCQWGACGMAREGISYERILMHYYTGVTLEQNAPRDGILEGTATGANGKPLANATVALVGIDREAKTDAQGHFRFETLPAATYDLVVTPAKGSSAMSFAWPVRPNETTTATLSTT